MAWRPDVSTGAANNPLGVVLLANRIDGTQPPTRFPILMGTSPSINSTKAEFMNGQDAIERQSCVYTGINEPLTLKSVQTLTYVEGKPQDTLIEEDYYQVTPVITRETQTHEIYRHRRRFKRVDIPRSSIQGMLPFRRAAVMMFVSDTSGVPSQGFQSTIKPYGAEFQGNQNSTEVGKKIAATNKSVNSYKAKLVKTARVTELTGDDSNPNKQVQFIETEAPGPIAPVGMTAEVATKYTQTTAGESQPFKAEPPTKVVKADTTTEVVG
jgi:hypothetical protein